MRRKIKSEKAPGVDELMREKAPGVDELMSEMLKVVVKVS